MQKKTRLIWDEKKGPSTKIFYSSLDKYNVFKTKDFKFNENPFCIFCFLVGI
jgi:hypothetical protein